MNAENLITDGEMWITTGESDLQDADRLGNICRVTSVALFYLSGKRSGHRKRRCVCKKEIMGKCQRDYEKTVMVCG